LKTEKPVDHYWLSNLELEVNPCPPDLFLEGDTPAITSPLRPSQIYD